RAARHRGPTPSPTAAAARAPRPRRGRGQQSRGRRSVQIRLPGDPAAAAIPSTYLYEMSPSDVADRPRERVRYGGGGGNDTDARPRRAFHLSSNQQVARRLLDLSNKAKLGCAVSTRSDMAATSGSIFGAMLQEFDGAARLLNLEPGICNILTDLKR